MKKLLLSLLIVAAVGAGMVYGTRAYFSDTETSVDNTFTTGTIDIAVDDQNPWSGSYTMEDMKPSQTDYVNFVVHNVGTNPVNLFKELTNFRTLNSIEDQPVSEPECEAESGVWDNGQCTGGTPVSDVDSVINYDLKVELFAVDPVQNPTANPYWWENIYTDGVMVGGAVHNQAMAGLRDTEMYLGMVPAGQWMKVTQSYHMVPEAGNEYQGDQLTFDIVVAAEQLGARALRLENKYQAEGVSYTAWWDNIYADLTYKVKDSTFKYSLVGTAPLASTQYSLIAYHEAWSDPSGGGWPRPVTIIGTTTSGAAGEINMPETSVELNKSLLNMKVWLVRSSDLTGSTMGPSWNGAQYLLDTGLMDYYDADL